MEGSKSQVLTKMSGMLYMCVNVNRHMSLRLKVKVLTARSFE